MPNWIAKTSVPLFVSANTLRGRKTFPRAIGRVAIDSGGFTQLSTHGAWTIPAVQYVEEVRTMVREIGNIDFAAIQDWMCEPWILTKTGLSVAEHQTRTIDSYEELLGLAPELPWLPVLQGWATPDYWRHLEMYARRGHDLGNLARVGVGSVCRRQHTRDAADLMAELSRHGVAVHAFGFKKTGLRAVASKLASSDSMAWSFCARRAPPLPGHTHKNCANCLGYALRWRGELMTGLESSDAGRWTQVQMLGSS